jgi:lysophospholipase L1-like esterase
MFRLTTVCLLAHVLIVGATAAEETASPNAPATVLPVPRDGGHMARHQRMNERVKQGDVELVMIGDSITESWERGGKEVWKKHYGHRKAVNLGISGDRTQHVLWRLANGNIDGIEPKLAVIMIGTNNVGDDTSKDIAEGIQAIVKLLRKQTPKTNVLVLGIFPRGENDDDANRKVTMKANEIVAASIEKSADEMVVYLDIGDSFLGPDRTLSRKVMPDLVHLTPAAYATWASAIEPTVAKLLGDEPVKAEP